MATFAVIVLPALAVSLIETSGHPWLLLLSVLLAMALSVAAATLGAALWARRSNSSDFVFADLMLWGWLRRVRDERRLAESRRMLGSGANTIDGHGPTREEACRVLQRLAAMLEAKDTDTLGHSRRVTRHAERIARDMGLSSEDVARVRTAASLHDIGKVHTPRQILTKPGRLTNEEFEVMQRHAVDGARMTVEMGDREITAMVRHHHERLDGSGYPDGLRGDGIPLGARIISVADTFDAITSSRTYHGASAHRRALAVVSEEAGTRLDPDAVAAFLRYYSGRRSVAWSAFGFTGTSRAANWIAGGLNGVGGSASPLVQAFAAIVAAALTSTALQGPAPQATAKRDRAPAAGAQLAKAERDAGAGARGRHRSPGVVVTPRAHLMPVTNPPADRIRPNVPVIAPPGGSVPPGGSGPAEVSPSVPDVAAPGIEMPDVEVPLVDVPNVKLPELTLPQLELPHVGVPLPEAPLRELRLKTEADHADG